MCRTSAGAILATLLATFLVAGGVALAHEGAKGVVKQRMDLMDRVGEATKELSDIMRGKLAYDAGRVRDLARTIADHGGDAMTGLFPEGSIEGPSEALPTIWGDWARFQALADRLSAYANALEQAADNQRGAMGETAGGMMMSGGGMMAGADPDPEHLASMPPDAVFMHLTQVCAACHQDFRLKKQ